MAMVPSSVLSAAMVAAQRSQREWVGHKGSTSVV